MTKLRQNKAMLAGLIIIGFFLLVAILADVLSPYDPSALGVAYQKPSPEHLLGTNDLGQDISAK